MTGREEQDKSADVVTCTVHVFSLPCYALLVQGSTLSFLNILVACKCDSLPDILHEPLLVSTAIGYSVRAKRVYTDCPINVLNKVTHADLIELTMLDFDIVLCKDWLHKCYDTIDH